MARLMSETTQTLLRIREGDASAAAQLTSVVYQELHNLAERLMRRETPGHTLGHISVLEPSTGILIAGDALRNQGTLQGSAPENTTDEAKAAASVRKLAGLDIKAILPGHGEPLTAGAARALKDLAATMPS